MENKIGYGMDKKHIIEYCRNIVTDPIGFLQKRHAEQGTKYAGYSCIFVPDELLEAAGHVPVRMLGYTENLVAAEKFIPSNCCELARSLFETLRSPVVKFFDLFLFSHCCDTLEIVGDIISDQLKTDLYIINSPTHFGTPDVVEYLNSEILRLKEFLEKRSGCVVDQPAVFKALRACRENDELIRRLYHLRRTKPGIISGYDSVAVVLAGKYLLKDAHNKILSELLKCLELEEYKADIKSKILLSGSVNGSIELIKIIEDCGCLVVDDDLCETYRSVPLVSGESFSFPGSLSSRIIKKFCPAKVHSDYSYKEHLLDRYQSSGADSIIFFFFPSCDSQFIEYANVKQQLKKEGIRSLLLELVIGNKNIGQIQTRIEAFCELMRWAN